MSANPQKTISERQSNTNEGLLIRFSEYMEGSLKLTFLVFFQFWEFQFHATPAFYHGPGWSKRLLFFTFISC